MNSAAHRFHPQRTLPRQDYLRLIRYAMVHQQPLFAAQLALDWLSDFPGDLPMRYRYGEARAKAGQLTIAASILDEVLEQDPEYSEAVQTRLEIEEQLIHQQGKTSAKPLRKSSFTISDYQEWLIALQGYDAAIKKRPYDRLELRWGEEIYPLRKSLASGQTITDEIRAQDLQNQLNALLAVKSNHPLVAITHLKTLYLSYQGGTFPLPALRQICEHYLRIFPNCLLIGYLAVEVWMDSGDNELAVATLHSLAARDLSAQVARRLWDANHPFLQIWPAHLEKPLTLPIPANFAALLGWNQLPGQISEAEAVDLCAPSPLAEKKSSLQEKSNGRSHAEREQEQQSSSDHQAMEEIPIKGLTPQFPPPSPAQELREIQEVFNRIGARLKQPNLAHLDGRQPVYVALSNKSQLIHYFGSEVFEEIQRILGDFFGALQSRKGWTGIFYLVDEGLDLSNKKNSLRIAAVSQNDPWAIKRALQQLDNLLAKKGQMIGALLIIGSHEIIPFHRLPNPLDDEDQEVYSDNPYGTRDENYLVMDWAVGRLPCSVQEPQELIALLKNLSLPYQAKKHTKAKGIGYAKSLAPMISWLQYLLSLFRPPVHHFSAFGYTAAAWRLASFAVFRQIGSPQSMLISPQLVRKIGSAQTAKRRLVRHRKALTTLEAPEATIQSETPSRLAQTEQVNLPSATAGYFNLHGLADSPEWFGQSDPTESGENFIVTSDHPVALQPGDLLLSPNAGMEFVFSEACFGAYILGKDTSTSLALAFLKKGCRAFVGSTSTSYGSNGTPLIAADFLAYEYWKYLRQGLPAGEALRQAKLSMAHELSKSYGYLDGEDQKTLISFVLYGDPLAQVSPVNAFPKVTRHAKSFPMPLRPTCDHSFQKLRDEQLPPQLESLVKKLVAKHLPGTEFWTVEVLSESAPCPDNCSACQATSQPSCSASMKFDEAKGKPKASRKIIILSRQERRKEHLYTQYARLTLDEHGNLIKLSFSR